MEPGLVFLMRHAESENNVDKREAKQAWRAIKECAVPTRAQLACLLRLLRVDMDSPLSPQGVAMLDERREWARHTDFIRANNITLVLYSPLQRARLTCLGVFPPPTVETHEHPDMYEKSLIEYAAPWLFRQRVRRFARSALSSPPPSGGNILLVGHSGFFRELTNSHAQQQQHLANGEIRRYQLSTDGELLLNSVIIA